MTSKIAEILATGRAPGFKGGFKDPTSADQAIPAALKKLEQTHSAAKIARDAGFSINTLKKTWGI